VSGSVWAEQPRAARAARAGGTRSKPLIQRGPASAPRACTTVTAAAVSAAPLRRPIGSMPGRRQPGTPRVVATRPYPDPSAVALRAAPMTSTPHTRRHEFAGAHDDRIRRQCRPSRGRVVTPQARSGDRRTTVLSSIAKSTRCPAVRAQILPRCEGQCRRGDPSPLRLTVSATGSSPRPGLPDRRRRTTCPGGGPKANRSPPPRIRPSSLGSRPPVRSCRAYQLRPDLAVRRSP
jgi:hypothetical protein